MSLPFSFPLLLFIFLLTTGTVWLIDLLWLRKRRATEHKDPWWVEYSISFFPVLLVVFVLRSFIVEPFKIPTGSMIPTLLVGDFILVNKYQYGVRLPIINKKIIQIGSPAHGDVMVFRYPEDPSLDYIKRVVGLPGDTVQYRMKRLTVNGKEVAARRLEDFLHRDRMQYSSRFLENLGGVEHEILLDEDAPMMVPEIHQFPFSGNCSYNQEGFVCKVPEGHYFLMGDNRDNSSDSRVWGFVPDENIVGKAVFIWLNFGDLARFGSFK